MIKLKSFLLALACGLAIMHADTLPDMGGVTYDHEVNGRWTHYCQTGCSGYSYWTEWSNWMRPLENIHVMIRVINAAYTDGSAYIGVPGGLEVYDPNLGEIAHSYADYFNGQIYDPYPTLKNTYVTRVEFDLNANQQVYIQLFLYTQSWTDYDTEVVITTATR